MGVGAAIASGRESCIAAAIMITTSGEGESKPEEREQLDVNYAKLLEWLMDRKIVDKDWNNQMIAVRTKITKALEGIPSNAEVGVLPSASDVTYSTCKSIMKLLGKTESSEKAMFGWGGFKSQAMNDWSGVVTDYEKSGLSLCEAYQRLTRAVDFEFKSVQNGIKKYEEQLSATHKKIGDMARGATEQDAEYANQIKKLGLPKGTPQEGLQKALQEHARKQVPQALDNIGKTIKSTDINGAVAFYEQFVAFMCSLSLTAAAPPSDISVPKMLENLSFVTEFGNANTAKLIEVRDGMTVEVIADAAPISAHGVIGGPADGGIDFGDDDGIDFGDDGGIDFGDEAAEPTVDFGDDGGIDFGDDGGIDFGDDGGIDFGDDGGIDFGDDGGIDFGDDGGIDFGDDGGIDFGDDGGFEIAIESEGVECSSRRLSAKEANAAVLSSNKFRTDLLTDLLELQAFIEQRLSEMDNEEATSTVMHELQHAPDTVQHTDIDQLRTWQAQITNVLQMLQSPATRNLLLMESSSTHTERLVASLQLKLNCASRFRDQGKSLEGKIEFLQQSLFEENDKKKSLVKQVKQDKEIVESTMADPKYGFSNYDFHLVGAINTVS